jgi:hypothetical protein
MKKLISLLLLLIGFSSNQLCAQYSNLDDTSIRTYKGKYLLLGTGIGWSYGGIGLKLQWRGGGNQGVGFHLGAGYAPDSPIGVSAGFKFFPYRGLYMNMQFGYGAAEYQSSSNDINSEEVEEINIVYGPSFLVGGDFNWGKGKTGFGFNVGLGVMYGINAKFFEEHIFPAFDFGLIIRFAL